MTSPGGDLTSANYQATLSTWLGDSGETLATSLVFTPSQSERSTGQAQQTQPITVCPAIIELLIANIRAIFGDAEDFLQGFTNYIFGFTMARH